ncbi:MAG: glycosyltransferase family 39 protein [Oscillospiraceae bacterium]|nr:glycosyltransferase family 39 protein [Oscillospiraceae bacterium]
MDGVLTKIFCVIGVAAGLVLSVAACVSGGWAVLLAAAVLVVLGVAAAFAIGKAREPKPLAGALVILALTLVPRIAAILAFPVVTDPVHDFGTYFRLAECLAGGTEFIKNSAHLFPHMFFFAGALSLPFRVFGATVTVYQIFGLVLSCAAAVFIFGAVRLLRGTKAGLFAALIFALCPAAALYAPLCCGEHLALALLSLAIYLLARFYKAGRASVPVMLLRGALLGVVLLALELIRPVAIVPVAAIVLAWLAANAKKRPSTGRAAALLVVLLAVLIGGRELALVGEEAVLDKPVARSSTSFTLLAGSNAEAAGAWNAEDSALFYSAVESGDYRAADRQIRSVVVSRYKELGPVGTAKLMAVKSAHTWGGQAAVLDYLAMYSARENALLRGTTFKLQAALCNGYFAALLLLFAAAAALRIKRGGTAPELVCLLGVLGFACMFLVSEAAGRYSLIALPLPAACVPGGFFAKISLDKRKR